MHYIYIKEGADVGVLGVEKTMSSFSGTERCGGGEEISSRQFVLCAQSEDDFSCTKGFGDQQCINGN